MTLRYLESFGIFIIFLTKLVASILGYSSILSYFWPSLLISLLTYIKIVIIGDVPRSVYNDSEVFVLKSL